MKRNKLYILIAVVGLSLNSCQKKYDEYLQNPNLPTQVPPNLVLRALLSQLDDDGAWSDVTRWNQFDACNYNYYGDQRYDWTGGEMNFLSLKNVAKMESEALRVKQPDQNVYAALASFLGHIIITA